MPSSNSLNKAPPFLELSRTTLEDIDTRGLDIENVLSVWTGLTKCSGFIKNGKRLENISWRIVNRQLVNSRQEGTRNSAHGSDPNTKREAPSLPSNSLGKSTQKLNDGDLFSLLSIVSEETVSPQRPQLTKRKSSSKSSLFLNKKSSESLSQRPTLFRKSSSSKSLKKLNHLKKKSNVDLPSMTPVAPQVHDTDLFEQPHPRYAFGIYDDEKKNDVENDEEQNPTKPVLKRNDTSTSIIRGFSTDKSSVSSVEPSPPKPRSESPMLSSTGPSHTPSLFGNGDRNVKEQRKPSPPPEASKPVSLFAHRPQQNNRSRSSDRVKSPLSHETTSEVLRGKSTPSLFQKPPQSSASNQPPQPQQQRQLHNNNNNNNNNNSSSNKPSATASLFSHSNHSGQQTLPRPQQNAGPLKSMLFDQVGISPNLKKSVAPPSQPQTSQLSAEISPQPPTQKDNEEFHTTHQKKRTNVLSNLGMTSLAKKEQRKEKNMFFIESSPSPTDTPQFIDSTASARTNMSTSPEVETHKAPGEHHHRHQQQHHHGKRHSGSSRSSPQHGEPRPERNSTSLFQGKVPVREVIFSSDDSLSEESDWSSVSEDMESEDEDAKFNEQWKRSSFKRDDTVTKPQIKRSLLSGLFLNEMQPDPRSTSSGLVSSSRPAAPVVSTPANEAPSVSKGSSSDGHDLSSSLSSMHIQLKQRRTSSSLNDNSASLALELNTAEPHAQISTSNVTVGGLVNEPYREASNLKEKLESTKESQTPLSSSFSQIAKSALHLTNYFGHQRKNSFSSIVSDRTRVRFKHESNAPPTASTLLPTALSTHMFLPNAHQRAKSRLTAVVETDGGSSSSTSTREPSRKNSNTPMHSETSYEKPIKSPTVPIKNNRIEVDIRDDDNVVVEHQNSERRGSMNAISRKLSPKTTRKQMLATELSDSLRKSMLWERQYGMYPSGDNVKVVDGNGNRGQERDGNKEDVVIGDVNGDQADEDDLKKKKQKAPKVIKPELEKNDDDEWERESFYARGW